MTHFRAVILNCQGSRWGGGRAAWLRRKPNVVARIQRSLGDDLLSSPSIVVATELSDAEAKELCAALGPSWEYVNTLYSSVLFTGWEPGRIWEKTWNAGTHGMVVVELSRGGKRINVAATHLPPFAWRAAARKRQVKYISDFFAGWSDPILIGGDFNWRKTLESYASSLGFKSARQVAEAAVNREYRTNGGWGTGSQIDYAFVKSIRVRSYRVLRGWNPITRATASDHNMITIQATV